MSYLLFNVLWQFHRMYRIITSSYDSASVALGSILALVGLSRGHLRREKEHLGIHRPNVSISSLIYKKICYSCGWMMTFKLPSRGWAVSRKPSTVSFNGKTCVIISTTLILL